MNHDATWDSTFSTLAIRKMEAWMRDWRVIQAASRRKGTTAVSDLTLSQRAQLQAKLLSTHMEMWLRGDICGEKVEDGNVGQYIQVIYG